MPAEGIILKKETYGRLMKMLEKWEKGDIIQPGNHLQTEEVGTGYQKLGVNPSNTNGTGGNFNLVVSDGTNTVSNVNRMNFIGTPFTVTSSGAGIAAIGLNTTNCN